MIDVNKLIGSHDVLFVTLDTLRYDVARDCMRQGRTPGLASLLPNGAWEARHSPGNFTYAAHQAFFAGFFPTPITPGKHPRPFAVRFPGSETTVAQTCVFYAPDIVRGLHARGYHTVYRRRWLLQQTKSARQRAAGFAESHWRDISGVTDAFDGKSGCTGARDRRTIAADQRLFLLSTCPRSISRIVLTCRAPPTIRSNRTRPPGVCRSAFDIPVPR